MLLVYNAQAMIRLIRALGWLRWRQIVNGIRGAKRRDTLERLSRVAALAVPVVLGFLLLGVTATFATLGLISGWLVGSGAWPAQPVLFTARVLLLAIVLMLLVFPLGRASSNATSAYTRLLLLPIPRRALHAVNVGAGLIDPWVVAVSPGMLLFAAGVLASGRLGAGLVALLAALATIALFACFGSLIGLLMDWLMRSRRRGEMFTLVFVILLTVVSVLPALLGDSLGEQFRAAKAEGRPRASISLAGLDAALPLWTRSIPSELYGRSIEKSLDGQLPAAALGVALLLVEVAVLYGLSSTVHRKLVGSVLVGRSRRHGARVRGAARRLPGLTAAASAIAVTQARTALRSVRGRLVVVMPGAFVAVAGVLSRTTREVVPGDDFLALNGHALFGVGIVFGLYALQAFSMNQFASDRSGLTLQLLAPVSDVDLVRGKAVGCGFILGAAVFLCLVVALLLAPGGSPLVWLAVLVGGVAAYAALTPIAALMSALFPVASDLSKSGTGGNPHGLAMLIGTLLVMPAAGLPGLIIAATAHYKGRPGLALLLTALWTLLVAGAALPLLAVVARAVVPRRENMALVAQGK